MLPNFLVIGAEKSATTWLYAALHRHPEVYMAATKETHFFNAFNSNLERRDFYERLGVEWYSRFFDKWSGERAVGEATPMYICDPLAPERIVQTLPEVRLIACLRNPIDRAYSHYQMALAKGHTNRSFEDVVRADEDRFIGRGEYGRQLERYLSLFPREQLLILIFEELFTAPLPHLREISSFLSIGGEWEAGVADSREYGAGTYRSRAFLAATRRAGIWMRTHRGFDRALDLMKASGITSTLKQANRRTGSYPAMGENLRATLSERFRPDVTRLESLLGRSLPWLGATTVDA